MTYELEAEHISVAKRDTSQTLNYKLKEIALAENLLDGKLFILIQFQSHISESNRLFIVEKQYKISVFKVFKIAINPFFSEFGQSYEYGLV